MSFSNFEADANFASDLVEICEDKAEDAVYHPVVPKAKNATRTDSPYLRRPARVPAYPLLQESGNKPHNFQLWTTKGARPCR